MRQTLLVFFHLELRKLMRNALHELKGLTSCRHGQHWPISCMKAYNKTKVQANTVVEFALGKKGAQWGGAHLNR